MRGIGQLRLLTTRLRRPKAAVRYSQLYGGHPWLPDPCRRISALWPHTQLSGSPDRQLIAEWLFYKYRNCIVLIGMWRSSSSCLRRLSAMATYVD